MIGEDQTATGELDAIALEVRRWQAETFGPAATRSGCFARLEHIRREVEEAQECAYMVDTYTARAQPESADVWRHDLASELADVFILLLSAVDEAGVNLAQAVARKHQVNTGRKWGKPDSSGVIEHIEGDS